MATQRETLFQRLGIKTADEIKADRRDRQAAFMRSQQDPYAKAGGAIGLGLSRLFSKPSEEELRAQQAEDIITDVMSSYNAAGDDAPTLEQAYQGIMQRLGAAGLGEEAMNMGQLLNEYTQNEVDRQRKIIADTAAIDKANMVVVREPIGTKMVQTTGPDGLPQAVETAVYGDVYYDRRTGKRVINPNTGSVDTKLDNDPEPQTFTQVGTVQGSGVPVGRRDGKFYALRENGTLGKEVDPGRVVLDSFASPAVDNVQTAAEVLSDYEKGLIDIYAPKPNDPAPVSKPMTLGLPKVDRSDLGNMGGYENYIR